VVFKQGPGSLPGLPCAGSGLGRSKPLFKERNRRVIEIYDSIEHKNLVKIRPSEFLCDTTINRCLSHDTILPYYYDNNHLSNYGAKNITAEIFEKTMASY
jgi:hypothetical protein